ncbi:MAG: hypothetical protein QOF01_1980 [Thermomicrobiales bacterium]|jgi:hypothetical protein|nr:hypothetical protein [Thermomicrobiales bacterium]
MVRGPYDTEVDEPPGGRAAERLKEFLRERFPEGVPPGTSLPDVIEESLSEIDQRGEPSTADNVGNGGKQGEDSDRVGGEVRPAP